MAHETKSITFSCKSCANDKRTSMFKNFKMNVSIEIHILIMKILVLGLDLIEDMQCREASQMSYVSMDLYKGKFLFFLPLSYPMISSLDVFGLRVVGNILSKVDDTLIIIVKYKLILSQS